MGEINLRAEYIMLRNKMELRREMLFMRAIVPGIFVCACAVLSAVFGNKLLLVPAVFGVLTLLYFYFAQRLFLTGKFIYLSGESKELPSLRFFFVLRFAFFKLTEGAVKFLWLNFFLLPSRFIGVIILRTLYETGNIQRVMLLTLALSFLILSAVGLVFYFYLSGRFFLSELLFIRCPGQKSLEILKNSALSVSGELFGIMLFRIRNALFCGRVKGEMRRAVFASDLFSDRKFYRNYGLIKPLTFPAPF